MEGFLKVRMDVGGAELQRVPVEIFWLTQQRRVILRPFWNGRKRQGALAVGATVTQYCHSRRYCSQVSPMRRHLIGGCSGCTGNVSCMWKSSIEACGVNLCPKILG
jgi:hypothetical protein